MKKSTSSSSLTLLSDLPNELLDLIFDFLIQPNDIFQLNQVYLVCKSFARNLENGEQYLHALARLRHKSKFLVDFMRNNLARAFENQYKYKCDRLSKQNKQLHDWVLTSSKHSLIVDSENEEDEKQPLKNNNKIKNFENMSLLDFELSEIEQDIVSEGKLISYRSSLLEETQKYKELKKRRISAETSHQKLARFGSLFYYRKDKIALKLFISAGICTEIFLIAMIYRSFLDRFLYFIPFTLIAIPLIIASICFILTLHIQMFPSRYFPITQPEQWIRYTLFYSQNRIFPFVYSIPISILLSSLKIDLDAFENRGWIHLPPLFFFIGWVVALSPLYIPILYFFLDSMVSAILELRHRCRFTWESLKFVLSTFSLIFLSPFIIFPQLYLQFKDANSIDSNVFKFSIYFAFAPFWVLEALFTLFLLSIVILRFVQRSERRRIVLAAFIIGTWSMILFSCSHILVCVVKSIDQMHESVRDLLLSSQFIFYLVSFNQLFLCIALIFNSLGR